MLEQSIPEGVHPMEGTHAEAVCVRTVACGRDPYKQQDCGGMCPLGEILCWSMGGEQGERSDGDSVKWTSDSPYFLTLFIIWGKEGENLE